MAEPAPRWLVTRAQPGADATAARLRAIGHEALVAPVLVIRPLPEADLNPTGYAALAFTSAAGVRAFTANRSERELLVFAVGEGTAQAAAVAGFPHILRGDADVTALADVIEGHGAGPVMHVSGADQAGDLVGDLAAKGIAAKRVIAYAAEPIATLGDDVLDALAANALTGVLLHSPRGAQSVVRLIPPTAASPLLAVCLSPAVARAANALPWRRIVVAAAPHEQAMLSALGPAAAET